MNVKEITDAVVRSAKPAIVPGRLPYYDRYDIVMLSDLVRVGSWVELETKKDFLALWVNDTEFFDHPDLNNLAIRGQHKNLRKFAAMDPVVDLESLRGRPGVPQDAWGFSRSLLTEES
ncbi:MAG: hypothetical protein Q4A82_01045 [Corynebacterium sp.]|nr:hypothetical protein [Corynebacterium sp.]